MSEQTQANVPPPSNTGVLTEKPAYRYSLDWLRFSVPYDTPNDKVLPLWECFTPTDEIVKALQNYRETLKLRHGRIDWHPLQTGQKRLVTLTGKDLQALVNEGYGIDGLLQWVVAQRGVKISRLDFAIDVYNMHAGPIQVFDAHMSGKCTTRAKRAVLIDSTEGYNQTGQTVYIGTRESMKFLRVYDKAKEQGKAGDWTRIELEIKDEYAMSAARAMAKYGIIEGGKKVMRDYITTGIKWFDNATDLEGECIYVEPCKKELTNWEKWVLEVAMPAVQKALRQDVPGVYDEVLKTLQAVYYGGHGTPGEPTD